MIETSETRLDQPEITEKTCTVCNDDWPDDDEFYRPGESVCIACETERIERRRTASREASERYRRRRGMIPRWEYERGYDENRRDLGQARYEPQQ